MIGRLAGVRSSISSRATTTTTPAGPAFFWAPAYTKAYFEKSTGRLIKSEEESQTSGTPAGGVGSLKYSTPWMVSLEVKCKYAAFGSRSRFDGRQLKPSLSVLGAGRVAPSFWAGVKAVLLHVPVTM